MKEYTKKTEIQSRAIDNNIKTNKQLSIDLILQRQKLNTSGADVKISNEQQTGNVQMKYEWNLGKSGFSKIEKAIGIEGEPLLIISDNKIIHHFNCTSPEFYLHFFMINNQVDEKNIDNLLDIKGGAVYCPFSKCVFLLKKYANRRNVLHELGHAKQHQEFEGVFKKIDNSLIEAHNVIVNENKYAYNSPPSGTEMFYLRTDNPKSDGILTCNKINMGIYSSEHLFYRVMYKGANLDQFVEDNRYKNFDEQDLNLIFQNPISNQMYVDMKINIHRISKDLTGAKFNSLEREWVEEDIIPIQTALTALMNWGLEEQIKKMKN